MVTGVEPLLIAVAPKVAGPALGILFNEAGRHLAPDEAKRLREALAEAIAPPSERPDSIRAKLGEGAKKGLKKASRGLVYGTPEGRKKLLKDLQAKFRAPSLAELARPDDGELKSWRENWRVD